MAPLPIEIVPSSRKVADTLARALSLANAIQSEFNFINCQERTIIDAVQFAPTEKLETAPLFYELEKKRRQSKGYHPFIIAFTEAYLRGRRISNLFGNTYAKKGLAVVTYHEVPEIVGDTDDDLTGYTLYYLARYAMGFASPLIKNHNVGHRCIYDRKMEKGEIIESFRSGAICQDCRVAIGKSGKGTSEQMDAVDKLIEHASSLVHKTKIVERPKIFIASSSKYVTYARALKGLLGDEFDVKVWDEDRVFRLGSVTIEQLEEHVNSYDFAVFVMLPDDRIIRDGAERMVPRDNVVFEAGLFIGKLSRNRAIIVTADDSQVLLPSDLKGLTTLRTKIPGALPDCLADAARRGADHVRYIFGEAR